MKRLLYLRGEPGTGKHTVGKLLAARWGWDFLWFHDLYRGIGSDRAAEDAALLPELARRLTDGRDLIYARPSRLAMTVGLVTGMARGVGYTPFVVRLTADYETQCRRVTDRPHAPWRASSAADLDAYRARGEFEPVVDELALATSDKSPESVAQWIERGVALWAW